MLTDRARDYGFLSIFEKIAASRLDKEVAAGRARYEDFMPKGYTTPKIPADDVKRLSRAYAREIPENPQIARHRKLNRLLTQARLARPDVVADPGVTTTQHLTKSPATYMPIERGVDLRTAPLLIEHSPRAGQFVRTLAMNPQKDPETLEGMLAKAPSRLRPPHPVDDTLNLAMLEHEFGEAQAMRKDVLHPHASHAGVEPLLREQLAVRQDPSASKWLQQMRTMYEGVTPDDDHLFARLYRQAGGTPNAPIQPDTRRAQALERMLTAHRSDLLPDTRREHVLDQLNAFSSSVGDARAPQRVGPLPDELYAALSRELPTTGESAIRRGTATDTLRKRLRVNSPELNAMIKRYIKWGRV